MKEHKLFLDKECETTVQLMNVYLSEWMQRDARLWQQVFKYFYASLVTSLLPNITNFLKLDLPVLPTFIFRLLGIFASVFFLYVSIGYSKRLEAIGLTYSSIISKLPQDFQRVPLKDLKFGRFFTIRMTEFICIFMFLSLLTINIVLLIYS